MFDIIVLNALSSRQIDEGRVTIDHHDRILNREDVLIINDTLIFYFTHLAHSTEKEWRRKNNRVPFYHDLLVLRRKKVGEVSALQRGVT